jgi:hypothetical protein
MLLHVNFVQRSEGDRSQDRRKQALDGSKLHTITQPPKRKKPTTLSGGGLFFGLLRGLLGGHAFGLFDGSHACNAQNAGQDDPELFSVHRWGWLQVG